MKERSGHVTTKKLRAVCAACNSGWMSSIEQAAQRIATPLITGKAITLRSPEQTILGQWLTLKAMVGEQNQRDREKEEIVFLQRDRDDLRRNGTIPPYVHIWIARYIAFTWRHAYRRDAALLATTPVVPRHGRGKNVQTSAIGIGELFALVMACAAEGLKVNEFFKFGKQFIPLWPLTGYDIDWPPDSSIDDRGANAAADALGLLIRNPKTIWMPGTR